MSDTVKMVVDQFRRIVETDGGDLALVSLERGTLRVLYTPGSNEECPECVFEPGDLQALMVDALRIQDPNVTRVVLETPPPNS